MADIQAGLTGEEFLSYQQKALDYLYDMPLGNDSLFIAKPDIGGKELPPYRVKKVTFSTPKLKMQFDEKIRHSMIDGIEYSDTVTIEWYEDAFNSVQKMHLSLIDNIVDLNYGLFRVGGGPRMNLDLWHFAYVEGNKDVSSPFDSVAVPQCTEYYSIKGMIPEGVGEISYDNEAGGSVKTVSITYHCDDIHFVNQGSADSNWIKDDIPGLLGSNGSTDSPMHLI